MVVAVLGGFKLLEPDGKLLLLLIGATAMVGDTDAIGSEL